MADYQEAFTAPFRIIENRNKRSDRAPSHSAVFNFTREEAIKAAQWFMQMAERVDTDGTTCSLWIRTSKRHMKCLVSLSMRPCGARRASFHLLRPPLCLTVPPAAKIFLSDV